MTVTRVARIAVRRRWVSRFIVSIPAFRKPSSMCSWSSGRNQVGQAYHVNEGEPGGMAGLCDFRWTKPPAPVTVSASICEAHDDHEIRHFLITPPLGHPIYLKKHRKTTLNQSQWLSSKN